MAFKCYRCGISRPYRVDQMLSTASEMDRWVDFVLVSSQVLSSLDEIGRRKTRIQRYTIIVDEVVSYHYGLMGLHT